MSIIRSSTSLRDDLLNLQITRTPLIDEFLFERDIFLLTSDAGAGKSIFALNLLGALSFPPAKSFLGCKIMKPCKVLYIQLEGDYEESIERLRYMEQGGLILEEDNICIIEEKALDVLDKDSVRAFFSRLNETEFIPEVVIIDPIYKLCGTSDISQGSSALGVIHFSDMLYNKFNCTNILIHHNLKDSYGQDGKKVDKDDSFYGHSFLKNHVRTSFAMKITGDNERALIRKKGRGSDTKAKFSLVYDPENFILSIDEKTIKRKGDAMERILLFIAELKAQGRKTDIHEVIKECDISLGRIKQVKNSEIIKKHILFQKTPPHNKEVWIPK